MSDRSQLDDLFDQALRLPRSDRPAFVQDRAPDAATRSRLSELLSAFDEAPDFLETPAIRAPREEWADGMSSAEALGTRVGRYELRELIGEGGFGAVYLAEQSEPVKRTVALKIIRLGMDTTHVIARFEAERQALALMDHPNIARVFDAGATETGRPYFVMEFVQGRPITEYCDARQIDIDGRLKLFSQVCRAVQHAHQKGVIHRDIKPSNVLVAGSNGDATPKVIDFGIAKATSSDLRLTERTLTEHRHLIGTPEYMSPEQASMMSLDVDTRSDIYSLGALLYELIAGTPPLDARRLRSVDFDEMRRIIREEDPVKPSTRLCSLDTAEQIALHRGMESERLNRRLHGDLDWIVMKCLEKDRDRRYETADGLASDIDRHLAHEPIEAHPPSRTYRTLKFIRRHRAWTVGAGLVSLTILLGLGGTSWGILWALNERDRAEDRAQETRQVSDFQAAMLRGIDVEQMGRGIKDRFREQVRAALARQWIGQGAERRPRTPEEIEAELAAFDARANAAQAADVARRMMDEYVLAPAAGALDERFVDQPLVEAQLHSAVGETYGQLGLYDAAEPHLREALAICRRNLSDDHPDTLVSMNNMGHLFAAQGKRDEAVLYYRDALAGFRRVLGNDHVNTLASIADLGSLLLNQGKQAEAEPYYREALERSRRVLGNEHVLTLSAINGMGNLFQQQGALAEAEQYFREALEGRRRILGEDHPDTLTSISSLGLLLKAQGKLAEAEPYLQEALEGRRRALGDEHPRTLDSISNLGLLLKAQGKFVEAEAYYRAALEGYRRALGDEHPDTIRSIANLGALLEAQGKLSEAEPYSREALEVNRLVQGEDHPDTLVSMNNVGNLLLRQGDPETAELYFRDAMERCRRVLGDEHGITLAAVNNLGRSLCAQNRLAEAEPLIREALETKRRLLGDEHAATLSAIISMGGFLEAQDRLLEAESCYREVLETTRRVDGVSSRISLNRMGSVLQSQGRLDEAEPYQREVLERGRGEFGDGSPHTLLFMNNLGRLLHDQMKLDEAESLFAEATRTARAALGDHLETALIEHHYADVLREAGRPGEAIDPARRAVDRYREHPDWPRNEAAHAHEVLAEALLAVGDQASLEQAERAAREGLAIRRAASAEVHSELWRQYDSMSRLGDVLVRQAAAHSGAVRDRLERFREAEPLLVESSEWLTQNADRIPLQSRAKRLREALERIVKLYESWSEIEPDADWDGRAAKWRAELEKISSP